MKTCLFVAVLAAAYPAVAPGQIIDIFRTLGKKAPSTTTSDGNKVGSALQEALQVATGDAVLSTSKLDGYFKNEAIKILMPEKLKFLERTLRLTGMGKPMDEFVLSMNRAAEQAAPKAKPIFIDAIKRITFDDARKILSGGDTAATDFFRAKTTTDLTTAFKPSVAEAMMGVGVTQQYENLVKNLPIKPAGLDLDTYVTEKAVQGLFFMVSEGEKKIRKDPMGQASALIREVFSQAHK